MTNTEDEISILKNKMARLEARLEELGTDYRKTVRALGKYDQLIDKHCNMLEEELADAFDRIKHIELTFFPSLAQDMTNLTDIIGDGEVKAHNPLDHRKK